MNTPVFILALLAATMLSPAINAEPTELTVRVYGKDSMFVPSIMGGVQITIHDTDTGELLASGIAHGKTGDKQRMMQTPRERGDTVSTDSSARYTTVLDIDGPRHIRVTAYGPLAQRQSANEVSITQWLVPGKHLNGGDGLLLELPGLVVDVLGPPIHVKLHGVPQTVELRANVLMMCGCRLTPGGVWDADRYEVIALLYRDGKQVDRLPLDYAGSASQFAATWTAEQPGDYEVVVYAYDPGNGNTGLDRTSFLVKSE